MCSKLNLRVIRIKRISGGVEVFRAAAIFSFLVTYLLYTSQDQVCTFPSKRLTRSRDRVNSVEEVLLSYCTYIFIIIYHEDQEDLRRS